jgi:glycosyltransferase EpsF
MGVISMTNRVLHVFRAMNVGGAETMVLNLYRAMNRTKIQFDFLVHSEEAGFYEKEILALGGRIFRMPEPSLVSMRSYKKQLYQLLTENQFSAVHSHTHLFSGFILHVAKKANIPIRIAHSHTTSDERNNIWIRRLYQFGMKSFIRSHATHKLGCSQVAGEALFGTNTQTVILPNSFNLKDYKELDHKHRDKSKASNASIVIGHVGRLDTVKNHSFFLETFFHFKKNFPNASAILVGDGPEKDKILELIHFYQLQESVQLLGIRLDIPEIMYDFDLFLFPSLYEGLGNVIIEAQAAGVPCLVSDSVPQEVNLSMNLVTFKNLNDGAKAWADELQRILRYKEIPEWADRENSLISSGYDVYENVTKLEKLYSGC